MIEIGSCEALVYKVSSLVDGGCRVTLDLSSNDIKLIQELLKISMSGENIVHVGFVKGE